MEAALPPRPKGRGSRARILMENKRTERRLRALGVVALLACSITAMAWDLDFEGPNERELDQVWRDTDPYHDAERDREEAEREHRAPDEVKQMEGMS